MATLRPNPQSFSVSRSAETLKNHNNSKKNPTCKELSTQEKPVIKEPDDRLYPEQEDEILAASG
ncbi:hypothetical protein U9M48_024272 [Paspalum notatum var. saurae]|uniref:Uncharacterized protein n=1 Tax=Paspalum notatum var. saurae TaxID=547442 RepID=A0AAQ3WWH0_PASNO